MQNTLTPYQNILIIKPGAVGDLLQMTPVVRALKAAYSAASITVMVGSQATADLFAFHPAVARAFVFDRRGAHRSLSSRLSFLRDLRRARYDLILNFQRSNLLTWTFIAACMPVRVLVYHKARNRQVHAVVNYLETLAPLGILVTDTRLDLVPGTDADRFAEELFARHGLSSSAVIALNPGASHAVNRWPVERFAELADLLASRPGLRTVIIGGPDDTELARELLRRARSRPIDLAGRTSLLQLGAVLKRCAAVVSGDTGPMHMATAVGVPVVALFGAADPERTGPVGTGHRVLQARSVACVPCRSRTCGSSAQLECMRTITASDVLHELREVLRSREGRRPAV